ncbi:MAG: sulfurtransferase [Pseudomonadales bacterium]|nr:sulfurtransferase [Pseudomonadales bacterium]
MFPLFVEPSYLNAHLNDDNLLIVDLCKHETWQQTHIPGAVHVEPSELVSGVKPAVGKLPDRNRLNALFSRLGYSPELQIVAYDDEGGGWAGRFLWTLDAIGHKKSAVLNGGLVAWMGEGFAVDDHQREVTPESVDVEIHPEVIATKQQVLDSLDDPDTVIWDARSAEEFKGLKSGSDRAGHIPGARNLDWLETMDRDNHLKTRTDIEDLLQERGITSDRNVITHCQTHHRSGLTYVIGKALGYRIRAYDGSWSEWGNDPDMPIET